MKTLKTSELKYVILDSDMYTKAEIADLAYQGYIYLSPDNDWMVSLVGCDTISVKYSAAHGSYTTVAKWIDGTELYVILCVSMTNKTRGTV